MKKMVINILNILLIVACLVTTTYGWWINGSFGDGVIIKSAKIDSIITIEKGIDFNRDGILDVDNSGNRIFEELEKTSRSAEQIIVLDFENISPSEVFTWRITVLNKGDVAGYVYANFYEDIDFTDGLSKEEEFLKFMSISTIVEDSNGNKIVSKKYLNGLSCDTVLFGGTDNELVQLGESIQLEFMITFELFDDLVLNGVCEESERDEYQKLQGKSLSGGFKFLDVSLSSYQPDL